jgi:hypothetical protein
MMFRYVIRTELGEEIDAARTVEQARKKCELAARRNPKLCCIAYREIPNRSEVEGPSYVEIDRAIHYPHDEAQ